MFPVFYADIVKCSYSLFT